MTATVSQTTEAPKAPKPDLLARYRPIGIASVLAAAMMASQTQGA